MSDTKPMLEHALEYLQRGWSVFPCKARGKTPMVTSWAEYQTTTPTANQVLEWWTKWPNANIAVATGKQSGIVVVDIDTHRGGTSDGQTPTSLISATGGGGYHFFYRVPSRLDLGSGHGSDSNGYRPIRNRVGADGIDVRGDGGYVILPPSVHHSGKLYRWNEMGDPGPCPGWVLERPRRDEPAKGKVDAWLVKLLSGGTQEGSRNDDTARLAGYMAGKGLPLDVATTIITGWNATQEDPLEEEEIDITVQSVYRTDERNKQNAHSPTTFSVLPLSLFRRKYGDTEVKWIIKDWLPDATIGFAVSSPGNYKTWSMFDLAISVASGKPLFGEYEVVEPGPVLIIQQEDPHGGTLERLETIIHSKFNLPRPDYDGKLFEVPVLPDLPIYIHDERSLRFDDPDSVTRFKAVIAELKPKLVIIDPLYSVISTDNYMSKGVEDMFFLKNLRDEFGTSFFLVHHRRKSGEGLERQDLWGSQFLNAFLETGFQIAPHKDDNTIMVQRHFKMSGKPKRLKIKFAIDTGGEWQYVTEVSDCSDEELEESIESRRPKPRDRQSEDKKLSLKQNKSDIYLACLQEIKEPMSVGDMAETLGVNKSTVSRKLKSMLVDGQVAKNKDGLYTPLIPLEI